MTEVGTELDGHFARIAVHRVIIVAGDAVRFMSVNRGVQSNLEEVTERLETHLGGTSRSLVPR